MMGNEHTFMVISVQAIGFLLAANACANLSYTNHPLFEKILLMLGASLLLVGLINLLSLR